MKEVNNDKAILTHIAVHKLFILAPLVKLKASNNTTPSTTKENNPKVNIVIGKDKNCRIGKTIEFKKLKIKDNTTIDLIPPLNLTDSEKLSMINKEIQVINRFAKNSFIFCTSLDDSLIN